MEKVTSSLKATFCFGKLFPSTGSLSLFEMPQRTATFSMFNSAADSRSCTTLFGFGEHGGDSAGGAMASSAGKGGAVTSQEAVFSASVMISAALAAAVWSATIFRTSEVTAAFLNV